MTRIFTLVLSLLAIFLYFSLILFLLRLLQSVTYHRNNMQNSKLPENKSNISWCKGLQYHSPPSSGVVMLVSYPGSGDILLRYLLQQVTGILTGSTHTNNDLDVYGFPEKSIVNGSVIVVNTRELPSNKTDMFKYAIILIRKPSDVFLADYNRRMDNMGAPKSAFNCLYTSIDWSIFVINQTYAWEIFYHDWLEKFEMSIHIVFYEILVTDTRRTLQGILNFLNYTVTEEDMNCALVKSEEMFEKERQEKKTTSHDIEPFTDEMYTAINKVRYRVLSLVSEFRKKQNTIEVHLK